MIDMHVHILPGVDDGAKNVQMAHDMARRAADAGITFIVATPHVYRAEDQQRNRRSLRIARSIAHEFGLGLNMGCEFNYRAFHDVSLQAMNAFCLSGTRCMLIEFSSRELMPRWDAVISELMDAGYLPIIAHPERYAYIQRDPGIAREMRELGCELQVDACGLMAPMMSAERRTARKLVRDGMADYIASDAHRPEDYDDFERALKIFRREWPRSNRLTDALRAQKKERANDGQ